MFYAYVNMIMIKLASIGKDVRSFWALSAFMKGEGEYNDVGDDDDDDDNDDDTGTGIDIDADTDAVNGGSGNSYWNC